MTTAVCNSLWTRKLRVLRTYVHGHVSTLNTCTCIILCMLMHMRMCTLHAWCIWLNSTWSRILQLWQGNVLLRLAPCQQLLLLMNLVTVQIVAVKYKFLSFHSAHYNNLNAQQQVPLSSCLCTMGVKTRERGGREVEYDRVCQTGYVCRWECVK